MKKPLETLGFLLILFGAAGIVHHFVHWFRLWGVVYRIGPLREHELASSIALIAVGLVVSVVADKIIS